MKWGEGQVHDIKYGKARKVANKNTRKLTLNAKRIPVQYARLVSQFMCEDALARNFTAHEALRRQTYAQKMLDEFGRELDKFKGNAGDFRSKCFTPVLQRQLRGIPDAYGPTIRRGIDPKDAKPTIAQVTRFYLGNDPLAVVTIPSYRHNLIYIREAKWHLGVVLGNMRIDSSDHFLDSVDEHDLIWEAMKTSTRRYVDKFPVFNKVEVAAIVSTDLQEWFAEELSKVVRRESFLSILQLSNCSSV